MNLNLEPMFFDIETNGFLESMDKIHCLAAYHQDSPSPIASRDKDLEFHLKNLEAYEGNIVAHNAIKFDVPAIQKLYPWFKPEESRIVDTLVLSRLIYSNIGDIDTKLIAKGKIPSHIWGSHSLEAWGYRLGLHKGDYAKKFKEEAGADYQDGDEWLEWSQEMEDYCVQDVVVLKALYEKLMKAMYSLEAITLEHEVASIIVEQERNGFLFDAEKAQVLHVKLVKRKLELDSVAQAVFPPWYTKLGMVTPKASNKTTGILKGCTYNKIKWNLFNANSRDHIADRLIKVRGWKPEEFTPSGKPQVDEVILGQLDYPEAKTLTEYLLVSKRISQLHEGDKAWTRFVKADGRIHGGMNTNGAITGRATHSNPNMGQVPAVKSEYGAECRELFTVPKGKKLVGADLSGLELRCLANRMSKYDNGAYAKILLEGDIHTANQHSAGLPTRDTAKTFIYAFLYGAGVEKLGGFIGGGAKEGSQLKKRFLAQTPALNTLIKRVQKASDKGYLNGLDGRQIHVRAKHSALNTLLQCDGALVAKRALVELRNLIRANNLTEKFKLVAWVHDEFQMEVDEDVAELVGHLAVKSFELAGEHFKFRVPITGEFKVGNNWKETH